MDPAWVKHTYIANPDDPDDQAKISRMCVNGAEDGVVGLDSEWNPNRPEGMPPNTLQICARDDVLVVQLSSYSESTEHHRRFSHSLNTQVPWTRFQALFVPCWTTKAFSRPASASNVCP